MRVCIEQCVRDKFDDRGLEMLVSDVACTSEHLGLINGDVLLFSQCVVDDHRYMEETGRKEKS